MSVLRQLNVISQMRLDVAHLRLLEAGAAGDMDVVVGRMMTGEEPLVFRGFTIAGTAGQQANTLALVVADSIAANLNATDSGSFIWVPTDRGTELLDASVNGKVSGGFVASQTNYVGVDFSRTVDDTTSDIVTFIDPVSGARNDELVPLGLTMDYRIVISTVPFSSQSNVIPVAKIAVSSTGIATTITDARNMLWRLAAGGDVPNVNASYGWPAGRTESSFTGGDKSFRSQKDWNDAIMTRLWELGGGSKWYGGTADRNVHMTNYGSPFSNGDYWTFDSGTGATSWQGIRFLFDGGTAGVVKNEVASGSGTVADGDCVYVDLDRTTTRTVSGGNALVAQVAPLATLGTGSVPGSRWVLAWRTGTDLYMRDWRYPVGTTFTPATTSALGVVKLNQTPDNSLLPTVVSIMSNGRIQVDGIATTGAATTATVTALADGVTGQGNSAIYAEGGDAASPVVSAGSGVVAQGGDRGIGGEAGVGVYAVGGGGGGSFATSGAGIVGEGGGTGGGVGVVGLGYLGAPPAPAAGRVDAGGVFVGGNNANSSAGIYTVGGGPNGFGIEARGKGLGSGVAGYTDPAAAAGVGAVSGIALNTDGIGVWGVGAGTYEGVKGQGGNSGGAGIIGTGGNTSGTGVIGNGGTVNGVGIKGTGAGGGNGVEGTAGASGTYGLVSNLGHVGVPNNKNFQYTGIKTGVMWISANEFIQRGTVAGVSLGDHSFGGVTFAAWVFGASAETLSAQIRTPRGATITGISLYFDNATGGTLTSSNLNVYAISGASPGRTNIYASASISIANGVGFTTPTISAYARQDGSSAANSDMILVDLIGINASLRFGGLRVTYEYQIVDFMV